MWLAIVGIAFVILCLIALRGIISISTASKVVTLQWPGNKMSRVLENGIHWLNPLESVHHHRWSYPDQQFKTRYISGVELPTVGAQVDVAPVECMTSDARPISLDMFLVYFVADASKAVCRTGDPLILLCQQVAEYARDQVGEYTLAQLSRKETTIGKSIVERIAQEWTPTYGLALERCQIQGISSDDETIARRRKMRDGFSAADCARFENAQAYGASGGGHTRLMVRE